MTSYLWCGSDICQARNASNATVRSFYDEGELVPGTPGQPYYYGIDQLGSVRRAFTSSTSAPAYSYDPYGVPLQTTAPVTDVVYAGMFYNADSGLYLTNYRAFDPTSGRWLSRDPVGEVTDSVANLYAYVDGNPVYSIDATGLAGPEERLAPHPDAVGPHSSFRRSAPGRPIENYETYEINPRTGRFSATKRFRGIGKPHGEVQPPMCYDPEQGKGPFGPKVARPAEPWEMPSSPIEPLPIGPVLRALGVGSGVGIGISIVLTPSPAY